MTEYNDKQMKILQVAEKLFAEKGYDGTSIRNISKEAKINIAMISYYFGSKEKLLEALIFFRTSDLKMKLESLIVEDISPLEKINKLIDYYVTKINCNKGIYQILHFEFSSKKRTMDYKSFSEVKRVNLISLEKIVHDGQEKGIFQKNVNIALIPPTILGTFFHFNTNRPFYENLLGLNTDEKFDNYINNELITHIQQTIKALLIYES
ncbi:TetR/AcrR family transcriptional regulator [Flavobacterium sp. '19STA2R22 D10 B1']|uniref:TetR/AcrR family transcriptional regulator n=1 Tax=Flavobacterium aerium TaxID=3037261 RepID=UPI00278C556D|nr:TetR family transcriptional regulator [Flavobacterium sp. '19STA2R22 D10 B1']